MTRLETAKDSIEKKTTQKVLKVPDYDSQERAMGRIDSWLQVFMFSNLLAFLLYIYAIVCFCCMVSSRGLPEKTSALPSY